MYFIFAFLFSISSFAATNLQEQPKWIKLLHYKKNLFGRYVSQADSRSFFLSPNGKYDAKAELDETIKVFGSTNKPDDNHPICHFPLRYKWLNQQLGNPWKADFSGCKTYIDFFSKLAAKRASIIFSSYYLSSPNSAFGHTLLRLSRFDDRNETEMLDYGINYAAQSKEPNPFLYIVKGLFGGFIGEFAAIPYYYKIREYTNIEFRDLWSYDLKFTPMEVLEMVDHIWELGRTHFDYFYFHENCSYHLLSILEAARPSLNLTDTYSLYTIPADTVRLLDQEGLIEEGKRRESTYSKLTRLSEKLSNKELAVAKDIADDPSKLKEKLQDKDDKKQAEILDVSIEAFDYYHFEKILADDQKAKEKKFPILSARAMNPVVSDDTYDARKRQYDSPAKSHSSTRLTIAENYMDKMGKATRFEYRAALHDLLDPPRGTLKQSQLEMGRFSVEVKDKLYENPKLILDNVTVFSIRNLAEQNFWTSPMSWELETGVKQLKRMMCFDCPAGYFSGSLGNSISLASERLLMSFLFNGEADVQSQFVNNYRVGLGPKFYTRFKFNDKWMTGLNSWYHFNTYEHNKLFQDYEWWSELELRHHLTDRISLKLSGGGVERDRIWQSFGEFGLQYFYE